MKAEDIQKLARLSKLHIDSETSQEVSIRITQVLELVDQLQSADTKGVEPTSHPLDAVQVLRKDEVSADDQRSAYQAMAPSVEDGLYLVPKVID